MSDLEDLYQEIILDHNKRPRNAHDMPDCTCSADGNNPLCGDEVTVYLKVNDDTVEDVSFKGQGCAISQASASLMTLQIKGKSIEDAHTAVRNICHMLTAEEEPEIDLAEIGDLAALSGVRKFVARIKCATLAWHTLEAALNGEKETTV